jgi:CzcA family heavy metal efflux pump
MIRGIVRTSMRFRFLVLAFAACLMLVGVGQIRKMPLDVFPEFAPPRVEIQTLCAGLGPAEVESLVTVPLEQALSGVAGLDVMRSKSAPQLSSIELVFKPGTDLFTARQLVQEGLATVAPTLPTWAAPPFILQPLSATARVMKIGLSSDSLSLIDMSMISYWTIRARLLQVPGVANVAIWGERLKMLQVQTDPKRLAANDVSLDQAMEVTADALDAGILRFSSGAVIGTGGFVETGNQRLGIRHKLPISAPADLAAVPVKETDGRTVTLGDVADVVEGHQPLIGDAIVNDGPGLMLVVEKFPWGNTPEVTRNVEAALDQMRPGLPGLAMDTTIFRPATFIGAAIHNLTKSLLIGSLLVVVILIFFLFEWRSALISLVTIPLSLTASILVLSARGTTINTMLLAGFVIALGAIVDDAIVDVENIVRRLRLNRAAGSPRSTASVVLDASLEVRGAVVYASLIEVVALIPVFFSSGVTGAFFRPLAFSYALAVMVSLLVALLVTPAMSLVLFRTAPLERSQAPLVRWLQGGYTAALHHVIRNRRTAFVGVGALTLVGLAVSTQLGESLFPAFKERNFLIHWITKPGTSLTEEDRIVTRVSKELRQIPGVRNFGSHIGQAFLADEIAGSNFGENWISVDPKANYDKTIASVQKVVDGYPGLQRDVQTYLNERIDEVITGASEPVVVRIFGPDLEVLRQKAEQVRALLDHVDGTFSVHVEQQVEVPQVEVEVDLEKAEPYGLKPGDVRRAAATLVAGEEVGDIFRDGKAYDVQVWSTPETRTSVSSIENLVLDTPNGGRVRLADVASVKVAPTPGSIKHESGVRRIDVSSNVRGRDLGSVVDDVRTGLTKMELPREYRSELLGEHAERQAAQGRLRNFALLAAAGVFLLLQISFRKLRLALLSFLTLPLALVGGAVAIFAGGGIASIGSLVGLLTVLGIVARNGIMLISHYQHLEHHEGMPFGVELVVRGAAERLAPILMTGLCAALALVPLVMTGNVPGQEIEHPMAIVILGGLVTSTLLNLFIVPALYLRFGKSKREREQVVPVAS